MRCAGWSRTRDDDVGGLLAIPVADTLKRERWRWRCAARARTADRARLVAGADAADVPLWRARRAFARPDALDCTDESQAVEALGWQPRLVRGSPANIKVTLADDLPLAAAILAAQIAAGTQHDDAHRHRLRRPCAGRGPPAGPGRRDDPARRGLAGHSDADVLLHAIADALLGALALGDLGAHFPDTDPRWKGADSRVLLRHVMALASPPAGKSATSMRP